MEVKLPEGFDDSKPPKIGSPNDALQLPEGFDDSAPKPASLTPTDFGGPGGALQVGGESVPLPPVNPRIAPPAAIGGGIERVASGQAARDVLTRTQDRAAADLYRKDNTVAKMFGVNWTKPSLLQNLTVVGALLHYAQDAKHDLLDPTLRDTVQPALANAYNANLAQPVRDMGNAVAGSEGEVLSDYMAKSALKPFIGNAPFDGLTDAQRLRAVNELDLINRNPVVSHWLRKMNAPRVAEALDRGAEHFAPAASGFEESLLGEAAMTPMYVMPGPKFAFLEGAGLTSRVFQGAATGASAMGAQAALTPDANLETAVPAGAAIGGGVAAVGGALLARAKGKAADALDEAGRFDNAKEVQGERIPAPGAEGFRIPDAPEETALAPLPKPAPVARNRPPPGPVVVGLSSDVLNDFAQQSHDAAKAAAAAQAKFATDGEDFIAKGVQAIQRGEAAPWRNIERTDTSFKPSIVTIGIEDGVPVMRAVTLGHSGPSKGMTIKLESPADGAEVRGLTQRWGVSPIVLSSATASMNPIIDTAMGAASKESQLVRSAGTAATPGRRTQLRAQVETALADVTASDYTPSPGFMIFHPPSEALKSVGGNAPQNIGSWDGAIQVHQLTDPLARAASLQERKLSWVTMPDGNSYLGFDFLPQPEEGVKMIQAPAAAEGIPGALLHDVQVKENMVKPASLAHLQTLGQLEPEALTKELSLYARHKPVDNVSDLLATFSDWVKKSPETLQKQIEDFTQRKTEKVLKGSIATGGVVLRDAAVPAQADAARESVRMALARIGINRQLGDSLIHVFNKAQKGLKPTAAELEWLSSNWKKAEQLAVANAKILTKPGEVPAVVGKPDLNPPMHSGVNLAPSAGPMQGPETNPDPDPITGPPTVNMGAEAPAPANLPDSGDRVMLADGKVATVRALTADDAKVVVELPDKTTRMVDANSITGQAQGSSFPTDTPGNYTNQTDLVADLAKAEGMYANDPGALDNAMGDILAHARDSGFGELEIKQALSMYKYAPLSEAGGISVVPPAPPPLPPIDGIGNGPPPPPPPPENVPNNFPLLAEVSNKLRDAYNFVMPAYSRGPTDRAQWALNLAANAQLETTMRQSLYSRMDKLFRGRTAEANTALEAYMLGNKGKVETDALMAKLGPLAQKELLNYLDNVKSYSQSLEQKAFALGMLDHSIAPDDDIFLTRAYMSKLLPEGVWAKQFMKDEKTVSAVLAEIKQTEFSEAERREWSPENLEAKAREFLDVLTNRLGEQGRFGSAMDSLRARNQSLTPGYRKAMGEVLDMPARLATSISRQEALVRKGVVWDEVSKSAVPPEDGKPASLNSIAAPGDRKPADVPGWGEWRLLNGRQYGNMNGKYLHPAAYEQLVKALEVEPKTRNWVNGMVDFIKRNRTIYNPGAWVTNVLGNVQGIMLAGGIDPLFEPIRSGKAFVDSLQLIMNGRKDFTSDLGKELTEARALGMYAPGLHGSEQMVDDFARTIMRDQAQLGNKHSWHDIMRRMGEQGMGAVSGFTEGIGSVYDLVDQVAKVATWKALKTQGTANPVRFLGEQYYEGMTARRVKELVSREAARRVATSFPMPSMPSQMASNLRSAAKGAAGAMNPFITMQLEGMRIAANVGNRMRGQGGEAGAEFTSRMVLYAAVGGTLVAVCGEKRRELGISDDDIELGKRSMSTTAQQYRPGLLALPWRGPDGNVRFLDLTSPVEQLRFAQGNPDSSLPARVLYNMAKTPISGTGVETWLDTQFHNAGWNVPGSTTEYKPSPNQLRGYKALLNSAAQAGALPGFVGSIPRALEQGGLIEGKPADESQLLTPAESIAKAAGANIVVGGNVHNKQMQLDFARKDALKARARTYGLPEGEQRGLGSLGLHQSKQDVIQNAGDDVDSTSRSLSDFNQLRQKANR